MTHNPHSLFEKRQRRSAPDNDDRCATDKESVLYHRNGKPVLDEEGYPVYVDRQLGQRPLLNGGEEDGLGDIPPEEKREDADFAVVVPPEEKREDADFAVVVPPEEKREDADFAMVVPAEEEKPEDASDDPDPLRVLLDAADCSDAPD